MASNDQWRGNGPLPNTVLNKYSMEDIEFLRGNAHLTPKQAADALSVKYGRAIEPNNIKRLAERWGITLATKKEGSQSSLAETPHDSFYQVPSLLAKRYELAPALEKSYISGEAPKN